VKVARSRTVAAAPEDVWRLVSDPYHLPRWWPRTERVEGVSERGWTSVLGSPRGGGRSVRADYVLVASEAPRRRRWAQELEGTPFERLFSAWAAEVQLEPAGEGAARVRLLVESQGRGWARFGGFMVRRAMKRLLDEALDNLQATVA
jgi:uncharacterized protein YndB with AHSA1/START domain